ncbi:CoA transferase [Bradyrhizobium sp. 200]|uniref:CaiB/BaiF CoA transferase family protein n=1 Tax=Bradyrhizobium sp. 200 TaxID=2782665 RepID=UPI00200012B4|nr:CoA transferase [Bradyrhizobium sp. 200]UPJ48406.1 CoA transferase [Bradyrhizobium sp. 200]
MSDLPLSHIRVLDLSRVRAGPTCVKFFGDFGADVIKIERPDGGGDPMGDNRYSSDYVNAQRNKRGITLDLKRPEGVNVLKNLVLTADVVVENFRPDVKHRLGIDYKSLSSVNPRLVYTSISAFGQTGPYSRRPGFDLIAQGMGGLMWLTGYPEKGPLRVGISPADLAAGMFAAMGTMIALLERERSGKGQWVQTNLLSSQIMMLDYQAMTWLMDKRLPQQRGNDHPQIVPTGVYHAKDGYFTLSTVGNDSFLRLCKAVGAPELGTDPRFLTASLREQNRDAMNAAIEAATTKKTAAEWVEILNAAGVPAGPIYKLDQMFADPQVKETRIAQPLEHPKLGKIEILGQPIGLSRTPAQFRKAPPELGEHTDEVLAEAGFSGEEISKLRRQGVV